MKKSALPLLTAILMLGTAGATQQLRFDDVVRNLRNPDPDARMSALEMLRDSKHLEAIEPIAPLVNDPLDEIQLAAIDTELAFYLVDDVSARKRVAFIVEVRGSGRAETAFASGPLAVWPRPVPAALLIQALDHYDPAIRAAAARVAGRLQVEAAGEALIKAVNDSQPPVRFAAMRALGGIREESAVQALTQQLDHYKKGEGAWSALDGLARIAHASSVPLFRARLADRDAYVRRAAVEGLARAAEPSDVAGLETLASKDLSEMVRAAAAFALQKQGHDAIARLVSLLDSSDMAPQIAGYFLELGQPVAAALTPHLTDPKDSIRGNVALILGAIGTTSEIAVIEPLLQDRSADVRRAAERAIQRVKVRGA